MSEDPEVWSKLVFEYGPYAILILFVLCVVPRTSKRMQDMADSAHPAVRLSAVITVYIAWAVVLLMVAYILVKWSPVRIYEGKLGALKHTEKIYPLDNNIYVKATGIHGTNKERWYFVLVDKERNINKNQTADFTYYWGEGESDYTDYRIPISSIVDGKVKDFDFSMKEAEKVYRWGEGRWVLASGTTDSQRMYQIDILRKAYAEDGVHLEQLKTNLSSSNRVLKAKGRNELRDLSDAELESLKAMAKDQNVLHQINLEQESRKRRVPKEGSH